MAVVEEVDAYDEDDSSKAARARRGNLERWAARVVGFCVDEALSCAADPTSRDRLEQRLAFADELRAADAFGALPLEFASSKKKKIDEKQKRKRKPTADAENRFCSGGVPDRYWAQRHLYFNLYDDGIELDAESWYSVTPERIAERIARRVGGGRFVLDAFCGCGGNAIQFAAAGCFVLAVDVDERKLRMARHNARIYDVLHRIDFLRADALTVLSSALDNRTPDFVFLSPPWGGPDYPDSYDLARDLRLTSFQADRRVVVNGIELVGLAARAAPNLGFFLPKTTPLEQALRVARAFDAHRPASSTSAAAVQFESHYLNGRLKAKTLFLGPDCCSYK
mmetsp:Transcript_8725/g.26821  ORF Transcript_8725/g.26821 Transcript_8725/m.26821 type:complete len:337 (-) Transcript_8725:197-1207(-)